MRCNHVRNLPDDNTGSDCKGAAGLARPDSRKTFFCPLKVAENPIQNRFL
jgi:hypothetical protein